MTDTLENIVNKYSYDAATLDNVGNRTTKTKNSAIVDYTYDNIYRLNNASPTGTTPPPENSTYDDVGNRQTR